MAYIKSHSNYVLKKKHQAITDGTVWERDITTIGGVNQFSSTQTPIYKSSNFIVTVRNDGAANNQFNSAKWKENISGVTWTLATISAMSSDVEDESDLSIVLKQDYYDFRDFAYYGSLTELFRGSVTDIVNRFPGELYLSTSNPPVYYESSFTEDFDTVTDYTRLGGSAYTEVSNPFGINIHSANKPTDANELKYFANSGYTNYELFIGDSEDGVEITRYTVEYTDKLPCKGNHIATITINNYEIEAWVGNANEIFYLYSGNASVHIRPKKAYITAFYNECDTMEKLLANPAKNYSVTFAVIKENQYGYYQVFETFTMPTTYGGYNIEPNESYIDKLIDVGEFYDERFSDNLYRSMTHEAIKNFDWTYTREYNSGDEEEYVDGGERIQKAIRLFAREFDEIKSYIDAIKDCGVTYNGRNNIPNYFLTDQAENDGWDIKLVHPYDLTETNSSGKIITDYSLSYQLNSQNTFSRAFSQSSKKKVAPYSINADTADEETKYGYFLSCCDGDFQTCQYKGSQYYFKTAEGSGTTYYDECVQSMRDRIKKYTNEDEWTYANVNNEFLRRLLLNSKHIWRHKGTMDSIEMVLGLFGLKSKRWVDAQSDKCLGLVADYDMTEYTSFTKRIEEKWDAVHQMYRIDWLNSTKTIIYDNRSASNYTAYGAQNNTEDYQGLPVTYRDEYETAANPYIKVSALEVGKQQGITSNASEAFKRIDEANAPVLRRYLYPNFDSSDEIDGDIYFQMNGGWLSKTVSNGGKTYNFQFDVDDNIVTSARVSKGYVKSDGTIVDNCPIYKETLRHIKLVDNIASLLSQPYDEVANGQIVYVANIESNIMVIDGTVYTLHQEYNSNGDTPLKYVEFIKSDGYIVVGENRYYDTDIYVYDKDGEIQSYAISDKPNGYALKAYYFPSKSPSFVCKEDADGNYSIDGYSVFDDTSDSGSLTNYYVLDDNTYVNNIEVRDDQGNITLNGWRRLNLTDNEYLKINTITNYYEGNNPHDGNMVYDNGHEYFTYFNRLFKYATDNGLFDERCYEDYYYTSTEEIPTYGFSGLIESNELIKQYDGYLTKDSKIHYFGNYKTKGSGGTVNGVYIYSCDPSKINQYKKIYSKETSNIKEYVLNSAEMMIGSNPYSSHKDADEVTNQIVNNKRFTITFYLHNDWYTNQGQCELKYLDDVVMNYLTQVVPSTAIIDIKYEKR